MLKVRSLKRYWRQTLAIVERDISLELRFKSKLITRFLNPVIQLLILVFIFGTIFNIRKGYHLGYWNASNFTLFLLIAFFIQFSRSIVIKYEAKFRQEKYWKTLSGLMVAPTNRFILLFGILISEFLMDCLPLIILFSIAYILYPIPIFVLFLILLIYFLIYLILASIGLLISAFSLSHEEYTHYLLIIIKIVLLFSCTHYPKEIFPEIIQFFVSLNPFYYIFDLLRLIWYLGIDFETAIKYISIIHFVIFIILVITAPTVSIILFNWVYKKFGITGY